MQYCGHYSTLYVSRKSANPFWSEIERWWNVKSTCPVVLTENHVYIMILLISCPFLCHKLYYFTCKNVHLQTQNE